MYTFAGSSDSENDLVGRGRGIGMLREHIGHGPQGRMRAFVGGFACRLTVTVDVEFCPC